MFDVNDRVFQISTERPCHSNCWYSRPHSTFHTHTSSRNESATLTKPQSDRFQTPYESKDWRQFIYSSKWSLKNVMLHNGNQFAAVPPRSLDYTEVEIVNCVLEKIHYDQHDLLYLHSPEDGEFFVGTTFWVHQVLILSVQCGIVGTLYSITWKKGTGLLGRNWCLAE